ncbi:MAG: hypothetical protein WC532_02065 [Candidatus Omnitrophota bacterium]
MTRVIYSQDSEAIVKYCVSRPADKPRLFLRHNFSARELDLLQGAGGNELKTRELSEEEVLRCEKEYVEGVGRLSRELNSPEWWANPISEKNEHLDTVYRRLCFLYAAEISINDCREGDKELLICGKGISFAVIKPLIEGKGMKSLCVGQTAQFFIGRQREKLIDFIRLARLLMVMLKRKITLLFTLRSEIKKYLAANKDLYVIRTWLDRRFLSAENYRNDAYFGSLPYSAIERGRKVVILGGIINSFGEIIKKLKTERLLFFVIPEEFFLGIKEVFCLPVKYLLYSGNVKLNGKIFFMGLDVTEFYRSEIKRLSRSSEFIKNIFYYHLSKRLAQSMRLDTYVHTFENYAWEKLAILGIREGRPGVKIIGFQHAFISRNSFKYFPGGPEKGIMPLPDKIVSLGKRTFEILKKYGNFDHEIMEIGCALRQEYLNNLPLKPRRRSGKILVPLSMAKDESARILRFITGSGLSQTGLRVIIRCHPARPFSAFRKLIDFSLPGNFLIENTKNIKDELIDTDILLYTWSTIAAESLAAGVPAVYMDILRPMSVDPLFECGVFKRTVSKSNELVPVINGFYTMADADFEKERRLAREYIKEYFYPVVENNLNPFFPDVLK